VVDNIPEVGTDRLPKLKTVILNFFKRSGTILSDYFPEMSDPKNEALKKTKGWWSVIFVYASLLTFYSYFQVTVSSNLNRKLRLKVQSVLWMGFRLTSSTNFLWRLFAISKGDIFSDFFFKKQVDFYVNRLKNIDDPEEWDPPHIRPYKDMVNEAFIWISTCIPTRIDKI